MKLFSVNAFSRYFVTTRVILVWFNIRKTFLRTVTTEFDVAFFAMCHEHVQKKLLANSEPHEKD